MMAIFMYPVTLDSIGNIYGYKTKQTDIYVEENVIRYFHNNNTAICS